MIVDVEFAKLETKDLIFESFQLHRERDRDMITFTEFRNLSTDQKNEEILRKFSFLLWERIF